MRRVGGWVEWWVCCFNEAELPNHPLEGLEGGQFRSILSFPIIDFSIQTGFLKAQGHRSIEIGDKVSKKNLL